MDLQIFLAGMDDISALAEILSEATEFKVAHGDVAWGRPPIQKMK